MILINAQTVLIMSMVPIIFFVLLSTCLVRAGWKLLLAFIWLGLNNFDVPHGNFTNQAGLYLNFHRKRFAYLFLHTFCGRQCSLVYHTQKNETTQPSFRFGKPDQRRWLRNGLLATHEHKFKLDRFSENEIMRETNTILLVVLAGREFRDRLDCFTKPIPCSPKNFPFSLCSPSHSGFEKPDQFLFSLVQGEESQSEQWVELLDDIQQGVSHLAYSDWWIPRYAHFLYTAIFTRAKTGGFDLNQELYSQSDTIALCYQELSVHVNLYL